MSSFFQDLVEVGRASVEAVHATAWMVYPMERAVGPNSSISRDLAVEPFEKLGCFYIESQGGASRFRPDVSGRFHNAPSLHQGQETTVSIAATLGEIKTDFVLHDVAGDRWFKVTDTISDGAGNIICTLAKEKPIS